MTPFLHALDLAMIGTLTMAASTTGGTMIELIVGDMMCSDCAGRISQAVLGIDAAGRLEIDLDGRWVRIGSTVPASRFVSELGKAGFSPVVWWDGSPAPRAF
jgi:copper chaperone